MPYIRVPKLSGSHPVVLDDAVQVRLFWQFNGIDAFNVLGGIVAGGFVNSQTHANDLTTAVLAAFTSSGLKALTAGSNSLQGVGIRDIRTPHEVEYYKTDAAVAGTGAGSSLPNQLACVVTLRTAKAGKSYRGRVYLGGADEDQNDGEGKIDAAYVTAAIAFINAVKTAMATEGITLAVLSHKRYLNLPPPADLESWGGARTPVISGGVLVRDRVWDTQRRRRT